MHWSCRQACQRPPGDETGPSDPPGNATGLEFDTVSVDLNELAHSDPEWWTLGKMMTYRAQAEPFVHIDEDVFLWQRLPRELDVPPSKTHCSWSGSKNASNETIQSHYKRCLSYLRS
jgi:Family of unknown function (DUF6734)